MQKILSTLALGLSLSLTAAGAFAASHAGAPMADAKKAPTEQQSKMKTCNADTRAKTLKGDDRKAFMKECLSADAKPVANNQQTKMKTCNADERAKTLKGDARKKFMSECLKG